MAIRYNKELENEMKRVLANYNAKRNRLIRKGNKYVPEKVTIKNLKKDYTKRSELKRRIKELQIYSKRGMEGVITLKSGNKITRYEEAIMKRRTSRLKRALTIELNKMSIEKPTLRGKETDFTFAEESRALYKEQKFRREILDRDISIMDIDELKRHKKFIEAELYRQSDKKATTFRNNYYTMLFSLAEYSSVPRSKIQYIKSRLEKLSNKKFVEFFNKEHYIEAIVNYYPTIADGIAMHNQDTINLIYNALYEDIDELIKPYE